VFNADICNSGREGSDISASWERILYELDVGSEYVDLAGPGYHNDFDVSASHAPVQPDSPFFWRRPLPHLPKLTACL
jgi:hypothetical protein